MCEFSSHICLFSVAYPGLQNLKFIKLEYQLLRKNTFEVFEYISKPLNGLCLVYLANFYFNLKVKTFSIFYALSSHPLCTLISSHFCVNSSHLWSRWTFPFQLVSNQVLLKGFNFLLCPNKQVHLLNFVTALCAAIFALKWLKIFYLPEKYVICCVWQWC